MRSAMKITAKLRNGFIELLVFFIGICSLLFVSNEVLRKKEGKGVDMVRSFYRLEPESIDVLVLGSSHAYYGFQPNQLWEEHGITSYVLGSPSQTMICSYYLLKEALKYQKPKVVLLEGYYFRSGEVFVFEERLRPVTDNIRTFEYKRDLIEMAFPDAGWKEKLPYYVPFLLYHSRWKEIKKYDFIQPDYYKGALVRFGESPHETPAPPSEELEEIPETAIEYFEKIQDLCRDNNIELVVFKTPITDANGDELEWYLETTGLNNSVAVYLDKQNIPFLPMQNDIDIDYAHDFNDYGHLNFTGQKKATEYLGNWLTAHYDLPSHKEDPAYRSWEKDHEDFLQFLQERRKLVGLDDSDV